MPRTLSLLVLAAALSLAACADDPVATEPPALGASDVQLALADAGTFYTVVFNRTAIPRNADAVIAAAGGELRATLPEIGVGLAWSADPGFANALASAQSVRAAGPMATHALPETQAGIENHATGPTGVDDLYQAYQWDIRRIHAPEAWAEGHTGSHETVVGILDTGVAWNHPDLAPNVVYSACFAVLNLFGPCSEYPQYSFHGTHVAGTVAAAFDHGRAVGVGPDLGLANYNVFELVPTSSGLALLAFDFALWQALLDAVDQGFAVANMSLGGYGVTNDGGPGWIAWNRVADYVRQQGLVVVASSGNGNADLNGPLFHVPGDVTGIVNVGATGIRPQPTYPQTDAYDIRAGYSNYGAPVTLVAPGGDAGPEGTPWPFPGAFYLVLSTSVQANPTCAATASCPTGYTWAGGTSMASPHVAGVAGLVRDANPGLNANQVIAVLKRTAEDLGSRQLFGHGMVDAAAAVN